MKIMIGMHHPKHFWMFKYLINEGKKKGWKFEVLILDRKILRDLLDSKNYARYRLNIDQVPEQRQKPGLHDFPCFLLRDGDTTENLWGATFRITMAFLEVVFGFKPPDMDSLQVVNGTLDLHYLTGGE